MKSDNEYLNSIRNKYKSAKAARRRNANIIVSVCICLSLAVILSVVGLGGLRPEVGYSGSGYNDADCEPAGNEAITAETEQDTHWSAPEYAPSFSDAVVISDFLFDGSVPDRSVQTADPGSVAGTGGKNTAQDLSDTGQTNEYDFNAMQSAKTSKISPAAIAVTAVCAAVIIAGAALLIVINKRRKD